MTLSKRERAAHKKRWLGGTKRASERNKKNSSFSTYIPSLFKFNHGVSHTIHILFPESTNKKKHKINEKHFCHPFHAVVIWFVFCCENGQKAMAVAKREFHTIYDHFSLARFYGFFLLSPFHYTPITIVVVVRSFFDSNVFVRCVLYLPHLSNEKYIFMIYCCKW